MTTLKRIEKIVRENAFDEKNKRPGLKFNPGLALIGLRTTGLEYPGKTFIFGAFLDFESLGTTSDVEIVCVAKTKMADVNSPAASDEKRLSTDDTNLQTNENVSGETKYLVSDYCCGLKPLFLQRLSTIR